MAATQKMIDYANGIAELLELPEPDYNDYKSTSIFISTYCDEYKQKSRKQFDEEINKYKKEQIMSRCNTGKEFSAAFNVQLDQCQNMKGIYIFWEGSTVVYIGKSTNLGSRILSSLEERLKSNPNITKLSIIECSTEADTHILEIVLIIENKPELNRDCCCSDYSNHFKSNIIISELPKLNIFAER